MASDVRRFKPELVESSSRTSKPQNVQHADESQGPPSVSDHQQPKESPTSNEPEQRCSDIPVTSSAAAGKSRRFLPQPTETSSRSSKQYLAVPKDKNDTKDASASSREDAPQSKKRLPEPVEVTRSNNKHNKKDAGVETGPKKEGAQARAPRRFLAEPIETMKLSRRQPSRSDENDASSIAAESNSPRQTTPRKFTPQLIETGKRSVRRAETLPVPAFPRITDEAQDNINLSSRPQSPPISRGQQIAAALELSSIPPESRFSYASLLQRQEGRRHSFRVPDLPAIPSNSSEGSDGSDTPSLSTSPSASSDASTGNNLVQKSRSRESCDERFSGYLLSLASRSAEKELREQALAAFPNEQIHQPVSHFAIDGDEEFGNQDDEPMTPNEPQIFSNIGPMLRRGSTADLSWELEQMRRHKEEAELKGLGVHRSNAHESRFSAAAIASRQAKRPKNESLAFQGWRRDPELHQMRHAASPPMLGDDIVFPFSVSPQGTATETDHLHVHHTEADPGNDGDQSGLWVDRVHHGEDFEKPGLWMGLCHKEEGDEDDLLFNRVRTGIATPRPVSGFVSSIDMNDLMEDDDEALSKSIAEDMAADPRFSTDPLDIMDVEPDEDNAIEREFDDAFITQVYNYLSLGYPALARYFDHELSKISGIPVSDLRQDDLHTEAKGHVVSLPNRPSDHQPSGLSSSGVQDCMRWKALKLYIHEWARQQPGLGMINDEELDAWGVIERRGSWAI